MRTPQVLTHYSSMIDIAAHLLAEQDPDFKEKRYRPYIAASVSWNVAQKQNGEKALGMKPRRSGPQMGKKYKK